MAGNIQGVNLQKLNTEIDDYNSIASKMHMCLCNVCTDMKNLRTYWTGKRINQVINVWNSDCDNISDNVFYFAMKVKLILLEIYDQYAALEKGSPKNSSYGYAFGGILKVELTDESNIKFNKKMAEAIVNDIKTEVNNAIAYLKRLLTKLDSMQAYSDSLKTLATTYKSVASSVESSLTKLVHHITTELDNALNDVNITEQYNESDAKRANNSSSK